MSSMPNEPLDDPVDSLQGASEQEAGADRAPVSGGPAEADSDVGYSRGTGEGESAEQVGDSAGGSGGTDYLDSDTFMGGAGDPRNG